MDKYIVVKDGKGYGVECGGAFITDEPMTRAQARKLAQECNAERGGSFCDDNPIELMVS